MDDLISRQAAIDAVDIGNLHRGIVDALQNIISELPSAQPEPQWIPCSETIDIPEREVLCCDRYGNEIIGYMAYADDQWLCESETEMMYDPIAWMPLPEPWRGEEHEPTTEEFMYGQDMGNPEDGSL